MNNSMHVGTQGGAVAERVRAVAGDRVIVGSNPAGGTLAIPFTPLCQCLSEETLKVVGPFYPVSMLNEVKVPTQGCVTFRGLHHSY